MRKRFAIDTFIYSTKIIVSGFIVLSVTACASVPAPTTVLEPTGTPVPTETTPTNTTLYRGNPQRSGVFNFPAIQQEPGIF